MDTSTLDKHQKYTRDEMGNNYYQKVIGVLKEHEIRTMIDAGACTGEVTKVCFEQIPTLKHATLIEPIADNVTYIKENLKDLDVEVIHAALYYGPESVILGKIENVGAATITNGQTPATEIAQTIRLEDIGEVDFLKLDVEGVERNIIQNSTRINKIPFIEIEFHHYDEELQYKDRRPAFINKWFPTYTKIYGHELGKDSSVFLYDLRHFHI